MVRCKGCVIGELLELAAIRGNVSVGVSVGFEGSRRISPLVYVKSVCANVLCAKYRICSRNFRPRVFCAL
jgi:hypothetical protein